MLIELKAKSVYGSFKFYPANKAAQGISDIARTTTIGIAQLLVAKRAFGAQVVLVEGWCTEVAEILDGIL